MDIEPLLRTLQDRFNLKEKHSSILRFLQKAEKEEAAAIAKNADVPMGRIYSYLTELVQYGLIERSTKRPYTYSLADIKKNIVHFMKKRIDEVFVAEREIVDLLNQETPDQVELIHTKGRFTTTHVKLITSCKTLRITTIHNSFPFALYPKDWEKFIQFRKAVAGTRQTIAFTDTETAYLVHRTYTDAFVRKIPCAVLLERSSFEYHLNLMLELWGQNGVRDYLNELRDKLEQQIFDVRLTDEYVPTEVDITERHVSLSMRTKDGTTGIIVSSKSLVEFHTQVFDHLWERSTPLIEHIRQLTSITLQHHNPPKQHKFQ